MGTDAVVLVVVNRAKRQGSEGTLDLHQLLIAQGHILCRQAFVAGAQQVLAVELSDLSDFGFVDAQLAALLFFEISAHRTVGQQPIFGHALFILRQFVDDGQFVADTFEHLFANLLAELFIRIWENTCATAKSFANAYREARIAVQEERERVLENLLEFICRCKTDHGLIKRIRTYRTPEDFRKLLTRMNRFPRCRSVSWRILCSSRRCLSMEAQHAEFMDLSCRKRWSGSIRAA